MALKHFVVTSALVVATASLAFAGGHEGNPAVAARKAHMDLYSFNLGMLGAMAKGETEYNADAAKAAAGNLAALAQLNQSAYWASHFLSQLPLALVSALLYSVPA